MNANLMTSNDYYGTLNRGFELRARILHSLGFTYSTPIPGIAVFTREVNHHLTIRIAAAEVAHADERAWNDRMQEVNEMLRHAKA